MSFDFNNKNIKDIGKESGKMYAQGLGVGMNEESYRAITAVEDVYVVLESLTKNAAKNAEKLQKKRQERKLDNLKNSLELELICEQEYYEQLKVFRDQNLRQGTDAWYKCTEEIAQYNRRLMEETQKQYEKIIALREELGEKLKKKLVGDEAWVKSSKVTFKGMSDTGGDLVYSDTKLKDFQQETLLLENYRDRLTELKNLGNVPQEIFTDIASMDVKKGLEAINVILQADKDTRDKFLSGYSSHIAAADDISQELVDILYAKELQNSGALNVDTSKYTAQTDLGTLLKTTFDEVPQDYFALGEESGSAFGEGFLGRIPQIMQEVRDYFTTAINELGGQLAQVLRQGAEGGTSTTSNTYTNNYTFNASKQTITEQLNAARNAATLARLRGGN